VLPNIRHHIQPGALWPWGDGRGGYLAAAGSPQQGRYLNGAAAGPIAAGRLVSPHR
jgi:hypothetical protein